FTALILTTVPDLTVSTEGRSMGNQPHNEFSLVAWSSTSYLGLLAPVIPCGSGAAEAPSVVRAVPRVKPAPAAVAAWSTRRRLSRERATWVDWF
ncbi:MAG: hypothetical protein QOG10_3347, partial [Kribbellaceae bacterium]|nr:hypothetical protein [Kribbellaceae bacterium]